MAIAVKLGTIQSCKIFFGHSVK